ncbi:MAG: plasminogen-binding N-terminal domain-containing protein [Campylobacterales bacterium]|nr:plasminogen-binding N-terminal domain-containing protein [Campylobacterales bacterium]
MKKIIVSILLISLTKLFAGFYPTTTNTKVTAVNGNSVTLQSPLGVNGMSGIVVHNFDERLKAIVGYVAQTNGTSAVKIDSTAIIHTSLPSVKSQIRVGDSVIGGYLYGNVLLLAPNEQVYADIVRQDNKNWIHPDIYATFLSKNSYGLPNKENLALFAKKYQVGLIYIVKRDHAILFDPISQSVVGRRAVSNNSAKAQAPFYMRLKTIKSGMFSTVSGGNYYQIMETIK